MTIRLGAALALAAAAWPGLAAADDFRTCDGYDTPTKKVDGMSQGTWLWGLATGTIDKRAEAFTLGAAGGEACDRALADPALLPAYWLRRAHLLQARGLHAAAQAKYDLALASLDASDAAGQADPLFATSTGLGNRAVRALVLIDTGKADAARREIDLIVAARPWSASVRRLAFNLRARIDYAAALETLRGDLKLMPESAFLLYWSAFSQGDYAAALGYAPALTWDLPKKRGGWTFEGEQEAQLKMIGDRADVAGARGFALAMAGRREESAAILRDADEDVAEALAEPPMRGPAEPPRKKDIEAWTVRQPYALGAKANLALWRQGIDVALDAGTKDAAATLQAFGDSPVRKLPILPAVLARLKIASPQEGSERNQILSQYRTEMLAESRRALALSIYDLVHMLPRHQTAKMVPVLKPAGDGYFLSDTGLSRARESDSDIWTTRFVHKLAPIEVVEEMAMFGAATTALREGKDSLVVLSRRSAALTTTIYGPYGGLNGSFASGYEAQLRVRLVNKDALPTELAGMGWRVIPARDVVADLSKRVRQSDGLTVAW